MHLSTGASSRAPRQPFHIGVGEAIERFRTVAFVLGCALLFWQYDGAAVDWLFAAGIAASVALWEKGLPSFDFAWPQPLLLGVLAIASLATTLADGSPRFLAITLYLAAAALALASSLRRDPTRRRLVETALIVAGCVTAATVVAGGMAGFLGLPFDMFSWQGSFRGQGLFKDPNVAGPFAACCYPLVAARCMRLERHRVVWLLLATALFACGAVFSFSRLALALMLVAVGAVFVVLTIRRELRLVLAMLACVAVGVGAVVASVAADKFPLYRYELQWYDAVRFEVWRFGVDMVAQSPLGTGAGSFEHRTEEYFLAAANKKEFGERSADESDNMLRNGALSSATGWGFAERPEVAVTLDPESVTGHAASTSTTAIYEGIGQTVPVIGGLPYSFAVQARTDGTPAMLIIHWLDERAEILDQAASAVVTSTSWSEAQLSNQIAPEAARTVTVFLTNLEPGVQSYTAARMVERSTVPGWNASMQWTKSTERAAVRGLSAHNTFVRTAVEIGVPGFLLLCVYWLVLLWSAWRRGRASWEWPVAFTLVLVAGAVIDTLHWRQLWIYTAVIAASCSAARVSVEQPRPSTPLAVPSGVSLDPLSDSLVSVAEARSARARDLPRHRRSASGTRRSV